MNTWKKLTIIMTLATTLSMIAGVSSADKWIGNTKADSGKTDGAAFLKYVRWEKSSNGNVLRLSLRGSLDAWEGCTHLTMTVGENNNTQEDLRAYQAVATTALTTGMQIRALKVAGSETGHCEVRQLYVFKK